MEDKTFNLILLGLFILMLISQGMAAEKCHDRGLTYSTGWNGSFCLDPEKTGVYEIDDAKNKRD